MKWEEAVDLRLDQLNQLGEFPLQAYESATLYKQRMKIQHDKHIAQSSFGVGEDPAWQGVIVQLQDETLSKKAKV